MKKILGLDLGTNSIGWAVVNKDENNELTGIEAAGSRIIPKDASVLGDFDKGNSISQTGERTKYRGMRRLRERFLLRRERLLHVLDKMGFLPEHYSNTLTRYGKFSDPESEPKIAWKQDEDGKHQFVFTGAFTEMLAEFRQQHPDLLANGAKIPYDWTIYYLRKKALTQPISTQELAWLLLNFNQKRGYYQLRGMDEDEETPKKIKQYLAQKVVSVTDSGDKKGNDKWFNIQLENGMVYKRAAAVAPDWVGKTKEFIVTIPLDENGKPKKNKDGKDKYSLRLPQPDDRTLIMKKTGNDIDKSQKTVGEYIYAALLANPKQKINGKLISVIERKYYRNELHQILETQKQYIPQLKDRKLYEECINLLYPKNEAYRKSISEHDFTYLFEKDIIFYQRPLKSKKSLIDECAYESHTYKDKETGETRKAGIKCIAKSHPLFQEFRLWQFISNLRILKRQMEINGKMVFNADVTAQYLPTTESKVDLFDKLNKKKTIKQEQLLQLIIPKKKNKKAKLGDDFRWNYVEDKEYPANETRGAIVAILSKLKIESDILDTIQTHKKNTKSKKEPVQTTFLEDLWHILYSVSDKAELPRALRSFAIRHNYGEDFVEAFARIKPFEKDYGAYSAKAIRRLLPLMRIGKYWKEENIDSATLDRINKIINGECDESISSRTREKAIKLEEIKDFSGLPTWLACYVVYNRHSESKDNARWQSPEDIDNYLKQFRQHSLHNPIVEQMVMETLRTVRDIWKKVGRIDEIHLEMGREMKKTAEERQKMTSKILSNEAAIMRAKILLTEFMNPGLGFKVDNLNPYSPSQLEKLRIYEDGAISNCEEKSKVSEKEEKEIDDIRTRLTSSDIKKRPTTSEVKRYILWMEQNYHSPYTGQMIPLAKLFTPEYQIEHIIPQSVYFDDSMSNKVVCEAEVNKTKDNQLGFAFIKKHQGECIELGNNKQVTILSEEEYKRNVEIHFKGNQAKMRKLLMEDIPDEFIARQLNDSRYISKFIKGLLSNIVRVEGEEEATSKNLIVCSGAITDRLKKDWGVNDQWNNIILPRFERLNKMTNTKQYTAMTKEGHPIPVIPLALQRSLNKKRIDHRHHAMDAIVIACTTRDHVNLLNNEAAMSKNKEMRDGLSKKLRDYPKPKKPSDGKVFIKPWKTFNADVENTIKSIVVSFKHQQRIINKTTNKSIRFSNDGKKKLFTQTKGDAWAIRKPMHKETYFGEINLRRIKTVNLKGAIERVGSIINKDFKAKLRELLSQGYDEKRIKKYLEVNKDIWADIDIKKIPVYYFTKETSERYFSTRKPLDTSFTKSRIESKVADSAIQKILLRHLEAEGSPELAFSPDGIEKMNANIIALNGGKPHQPIIKVRTYEKSGIKFAVGKRGNRKTKFVEAAENTNLFFAIYEKETIDKKSGETKKVRSYATIPLNVVIERQKQGLPSVPENKEGLAPKYVLSPFDLVYVPTKEEQKTGKIEKPLKRERLYKAVSFSGHQCFFVLHTAARPIVDKFEFSSENKMERVLSEKTGEEDLGDMIKETCIPVYVNRLGEITLET